MLFPSQRLMRDQWDATVAHPVAPPTCRIAGSTLEPASSSPDWSLYSFREVKTYLETTKGAGRTIKFDVEVRPGSAGEIGVGFLRSPHYKLGKAVCRVGEQEKVLDGFWSRKASLTECVTPLSPLASSPLFSPSSSLLARTRSALPSRHLP